MMKESERREKSKDYDLNGLINLYQKLFDKSLMEEATTIMIDYWEYQISYDEAILAIKAVMYEVNRRRGNKIKEINPVRKPDGSMNFEES